MLAAVAYPAMPAATAQEPDGASCAAISAPLARLACYDDLYRPETLSEGPAQSQWQVSSDTSPVSGWNNIHLEVVSTDPVPIDFGPAQNGKFQVRCVDNVTSALFWFGGNYVSDFGAYRRVTYQIDGRARQTIDADATADNQYIGLLSGQRAIPFVSQILNAETLNVSVLPVNESDTPVTMRFNIAGMSEAVRPLRESCNW